MSEVIKLRDVPPKTKEEKYRDITFELTYIPGTGEWEWSFVYTTSFKQSGICKSLGKARQAAHERIDKLKGK